MFDNAGKNKVAAILAPVGLVIGLSAASVQAADDGPFVTTPGGMGVVNNFGECWEGVGGMSSTGNCGAKEMKAMDGDADGDGVPDSKDQCPNTPQGVAVNAVGCPLDSDGDGVPDYMDDCPGTRAGTKVDARGCEIAGDVVINVTADHFDFDSATLKPAMESELDDVAAKISASPGSETLEVVGHTDSTGPEGYNQGLSERRAQAAADYLAGKGISESSITVRGMGESAPVADNGTRDGRAMNRRVEILTR
ncbi:MAG: OmpA family protein [Chromatiaceae bacterium]|nr:OmpA family protein [Gammaproteobacteria bacterium]MCP5306010.1 OmpA family protein [Chromatiaceae bacterium]MCP5316075.1 OmpA family protein [Chromatiaceae bacterium]